MSHLRSRTPFESSARGEQLDLDITLEVLPKSWELPINRNSDECRLKENSMTSFTISEMNKITRLLQWILIFKRSYPDKKQKIFQLRQGRVLLQIPINPLQNKRK